MSRHPNHDIPLEYISNAGITIDSFSESINDGKVFRVSGKTASLAAGATAYLAFRTPFRPSRWGGGSKHNQ